MAASLCLLLALLAITTFGGAPTFSQSQPPGDTAVIAPGLTALTIDERGVTGPESVVGGVSTRPLFQGRLLPGKDSASFEIPKASITWRVTVDEETGSFIVRAPKELAPGTYTLLIDGQKVATFTVSEAAGAGGDDDTLLVLIIVVAAVVGAVTVTGVVFYLRRVRGA